MVDGFEQVGQELCEIEGEGAHDAFEEFDCAFDLDVFVF